MHSQTDHHAVMKAVSQPPANTAVHVLDVLVLQISDWRPFVSRDAFDIRVGSVRTIPVRVGHCCFETMASEGRRAVQPLRQLYELLSSTEILVTARDAKLSGLCPAHGVFIVGIR